MDVKIFLQNHLPQKRVSIFHQVFQCLQYRHLVKGIENKMKKFCESLREHTIKIMNFKKKKLLTNEEQK